jgi:hypothetical protein
MTLRDHTTWKLFVCNSIGMAELRVTITGDLEGEFVIQEEQPDGTLVVVRAEAWEAEQRQQEDHDAQPDEAAGTPGT